MEEQTTTEATVQDQASVTTQPEGQQTEAVTTTDQDTTTQSDDTTTQQPADTATSTDDDLADYWSKKGIDITTEEGQRAAAKSYREAEQAMHNKAQQASELAKQINLQPINVDTDNELVRQAVEKSSQLETTLAVRDWKASKGITPEQDVALGDYVTKRPEIATMLRNGLLSLDDVYSMSGVATVDSEALKKQGGQEALQKLATTQRSTAPAGSASQRTTPPKADPIMAGLSD